MMRGAEINRFDQRAAEAGQARQGARWRWLPRGAVFLSQAVLSILRGVIRAGARVISAAENWLFDGKKALFGIAITRILLGISACGLLLTNFSTRLYTFGSGSAWNGEMQSPESALPRVWLFSSFHHAMANDALFTTLYVLLFGLAILFTLGWRIRFVLPVFLVLWVSFIEVNNAVGDQGDNMFRIALILLLFADPAARWSLDARRRARRQAPRAEAPITQLGTVLHNLALVALAAQVCFVYAAGGLYKAQGEPWAGGYAVYDPLMTDRFSPWPMLNELATAWGPAVTIASWGSILLQVAFPLMLLTRPTRIVALIGILSFHLGIAVLMGLPWFSLTMIAIDAIFISSASWQRLASAIRTGWREAGDSSQGSVATLPRRAADSAGGVRSVAVVSERVSSVHQGSREGAIPAVLREGNVRDAQFPAVGVPQDQ